MQNGASYGGYGAQAAPAYHAPQHGHHGEPIMVTGADLLSKQFEQCSRPETILTSFEISKCIS